LPVWRERPGGGTFTANDRLAAATINSVFDDNTDHHFFIDIFGDTAKAY